MAFSLNGGGQPIGDLISDGYVAFIGDSLWIDLDGSDGIDGNSGGGDDDDYLIVQFTDGGGGFDITLDLIA